METQTALDIELTEEEQAILRGGHGETKRKALDSMGWHWLGLAVGLILCLLYTGAVAGQGLWFMLASTPGPVDEGGALVRAGSGAVYALQGFPPSASPGNSKFWRYDIAQNTWVTLADHPARASWGGALAWAGGDSIYAFSGGSTRFWRYSIAANGWSALADAPAWVGQGGCLGWTGGDYIFAWRGNSATFWRYSIAANTWVTRTSAPEAVSGGAALAWTGGDYLYAIRGHGSTTFWRYRISTDVWEVLPPTPLTFASGAGLAWDGGAFLYAMMGNNGPFGRRYNLTAGTWSNLPNAPRIVKNGGAVAWASGKLFVLCGNGTTDFMAYVPEFVPTAHLFLPIVLRQSGP